MNRLFYINPIRHSFRKILNFVNVIIQWKLLKNSRVVGYPIKMNICPGNVCNLHCALCPTGQGSDKRKKGLMGFELFKQILDECGPYLYRLELFNWGEPLLNKDIFRMISYAKSFGIEVEISTNLNHFDEIICDNLISTGLDLLTVSLDGTSQQSVSAYQKGSDFERVVSNIKKIQMQKKLRKSKYPVINWRFLVNKYSEGEIDEAKNLAPAIGIDNLEIGIFRCDMGTEILMNNNAQIESVKDWLPSDEAFSLYDYSKKGKKNILNDACKWLWLKPTINWNGSVSPCCAIWDQKFDFGVVGDSSFIEIWNNKKYQEARSIISGKSNCNSDNICAICKKNKAQF